MLQNLIRYFKGYLRIRISGNAVERFINTCSYRGIDIWNLASNLSFYELNIAVRDFKNLKPVIRKTRTKAVIVKRTGFPFFMQKYRHRKLFFSGFILFLTIIIYLTTFIWNIKIIGNHTYSTESIITFLDSAQIHKGIKIDKIDCSKISRIIRQNFKDIIWVSTSISGSRLIIHIKENEDSKEIVVSHEDIKEPYDIISNGNYQITKVIMRNGIAKVKELDYVNQGDVLISGQIPVYNDAKEIIGYQYCISDADIYGKTNIVYEDEMNLQTYDKELCGVEKNQYILGVGKYRVRLGGIKNNYDSFTEYSKKYDLNGIFFEIRSVCPYTKKNRYYSENEIRELLSASFAYYCQELEKKGVVILKNNVKIYTWSDKAKATGTLTVEMPIGHRVKSQLIETGDHIDGNDGNNN